MIRTRGPRGPAGTGAAVPTGIGYRHVTGGVEDAAAYTAAQVAAELAVVGAVTPDLATGTVTDTGACVGTGGSGSFVTVVSAGAADGAGSRVVLAWPLPRADPWEIRCRMSFAEAGAGIRVGEIGVLLSNATVLKVQVDGTYGGQVRHGAEPTPGSGTGIGSWTGPAGATEIFLRFRGDGSRLACWWSLDESAWTCVADEHVSTAKSGLGTPPTWSLRAQVITVGGVPASDTSTSTIDEIVLRPL